jgi:Ca2+-binding EF-hand superfamily protein
LFLLQSNRNAKGPAKKATKTYERPGLTEEEIEEIREAFNLFDTDGSGECISCNKDHLVY